MQRGGQTVFDHLFFFEVLKRGVQLFEAVKIVEHSFYNFVHDFFVHISGGHKGRFHAECFHIRVGAFVHATGDGGVCVERVVGDQFVDRFAFNRHQLGVDGRHGFLDRPVGV